MAFEGHDLAVKKSQMTSRRHALEWVVGARKTFIFSSPSKMVYAQFLAGVIEVTGGGGNHCIAQQVPAIA